MKFANAAKGSSLEIDIKRMFQKPRLISSRIRNLMLSSIPLDSSYYNLNARQRNMWNIFFRWIIPQKERWFFEGNRNICGQLWQAERKLIYDTVRKVQPYTSFEVGTWRGGGSTYFISQALYENGFGVLHTIELDDGFYKETVNNYQKYAPHLMPHVIFHNGSSTEIYPQILDSCKVDLVFLDGLGGDQTFREFRMFEPRMNTGAILIAHDWNDEKMSKLRPYLEEKKDWRHIASVDPPQSVGLVIYQLIDNEE